jgi:hypothetical protein
MSASGLRFSWPELEVLAADEWGVALLWMYTELARSCRIIGYRRRCITVEALCESSNPDLSPRMGPGWIHQVLPVLWVLSSGLCGTEASQERRMDTQGPGLAAAAPRSHRRLTESESLECMQARYAL